MPPMRRLLAAPLVVLVLAAPTLLGATGAGAASAPNPCKVLTPAQISKVFGGAEVSSGKKGIETAVNTQCTYDVAASADLPEGTLTVIVMFFRGKAAYDGLKDTAGYVPTTGLSKSIYNEQLSVVNTLKGDKLLGMQGLFSDGTLPITQIDVESQLVELSKLGLKKT